MQQWKYLHTRPAKEDLTFTKNIIEIYVKPKDHENFMWSTLLCIDVQHVMHCTGRSLLFYDRITA